MTSISSILGRRLAEKRAIRKFFTVDVHAIGRIHRLTDQNRHLEAYIEGARVLGLPKLRDEFVKIKKIRDREGHLPRAASDRSYMLYQRMMKGAEARLPPSTYKQFHMAF